MYRIIAGSWSGSVQKSTCQGLDLPNKQALAGKQGVPVQAKNVLDAGQRAGILVKDH